MILWIQVLYISSSNFSTSSSIISTGLYPDLSISLNSLDLSDASDGDILMIQEGKPVWFKTLPSVEDIISNEALSATFEKLIQAYQEFKMIEKLSKDSFKLYCVFGN